MYDFCRFYIGLIDVQPHIANTQYCLFPVTKHANAVIIPQEPRGGDPSDGLAEKRGGDKTEKVVVEPVGMSPETGNKPSVPPPTTTGGPEGEVGQVRQAEGEGHEETDGGAGPSKERAASKEELIRVESVGSRELRALPTSSTQKSVQSGRYQLHRRLDPWVLKSTKSMLDVLSYPR